MKAPFYIHWKYKIIRRYNSFIFWLFPKRLEKFKREWKEHHEEMKREMEKIIKQLEELKKNKE